MVIQQLPSRFPGLRVLVVEDLVALAIQYRTLASKLEVEVVTAASVSQAKRLSQQGPWHAALVDLHLPDGSGYEVMAHLLEAHPSCAVVVITAEDSLDHAVRASEGGAFDFIEKPVEAERLLVTLRNALHAGRLTQQVAQLQTQAPEQFEQFIGQSAEMQTVYRMIETVATSNVPICITGESGTGKELAALAIHARSPRRGKAWVPINCASIPKELIESELFGHAKGAFTGALTERLGAFSEADNSTLFLDEIAELDLNVQAKLLRVLQTGEVKRLGDDKTRRTDVRIICATHRNLMARVRSGEFREDLFYRLYVVPIALPPLRSRGADIVLIAQTLLRRHAKAEGKDFRDFSSDAMAALRSHPWPGNVRELVNVIRAVVALHSAQTVELSMLSVGGAQLLPVLPCPAPESTLEAQPEPGLAPWFLQSAGTPTPVLPADKTRIRPLAEVEQEAIDYALRTFDGNVAKAARALKINPSTLYRKIQGWSSVPPAPAREGPQ
jgi:two-component system, repressor protein LuxO